MSAERDDPEPADDDLIGPIQAWLDRVPEPLQPLDISAIDGFLCALAVQPDDLAPERWLRCIIDLDGRAPPAGFDAAPLNALVLRRHLQLQRAIAARQWFDPWVFEMAEPAPVSASVLPWAAGFAAAMDRFPALMQRDEAEILEPLALIYLHFDAEDLEDAEALQRLIESIEPPQDLAEAVQDIVRSVMLLADVTRPRQQPRHRTGGRRQR
jgi:uncharacterized protein